MFRKNNNFIPISENVDENIKTLENEFGNSADLSIRKLNFSTNTNVSIIHIEGIVDEQSINENVIKPILHLLKEIESTNATKDLADQIIQIISVASINIILAVFI